MTTPAELPDVIACGLTAFASSPLISIAAPDCARLVQAGIDARLWSDFNYWLTGGGKVYREGSIYLTAKIKDEIAGYAKLKIPPTMLEQVKDQPAFAERLNFSEDELRRALEDARNKDLDDKHKGLDMEALDVFDARQEEVMERHPEFVDGFCLSV